MSTYCQIRCDSSDNVCLDLYFCSPMQFVLSYSAPLAPRNLRVIKRSSTSLTVSWERPYSPFSNLNVYQLVFWKGTWNRLSTKTGIEVISNEPVIEHTITDLEPNTEYNIEVSHCV